MKNAIHTLKLLAAVLAAGLGACQDAAVEVYDASLGSLLRPSAVKAPPIPSTSPYRGADRPAHSGSNTP